MNFKQKTGVNIVRIVRGNIKNNIPTGSDCLYPFDKIVVVGSDDELQKFALMIEEKHKTAANAQEYEEDIQIEMSQYVVTVNSPLVGKSLRDTQIREKTECMVIGIDRDGHSIADFSADTVFEVDDVLWLAGEPDKLSEFDKNIE